jgi:hypothetical protein
MRDVKEIKIKDRNGIESEYRITQLSAMDSLKLTVMGATNGITTIMPKLANDEQLLEKFTIMIMKNVEKKIDEKNYIRLETIALIDNHVEDIKVLATIADRMMDFSMGFSIAGNLQNFLKSTTDKVPAIAQKILVEFQKSLSKKK